MKLITIALVLIGALALAGCEENHLTETNSKPHPKDNWYPFPTSCPIYLNGVATDTSVIKRFYPVYSPTKWYWSTDENDYWQIGYYEIKSGTTSSKKDNACIYNHAHYLNPGKYRYLYLLEEVGGGNTQIHRFFKYNEHQLSYTRFVVETNGDIANVEYVNGSKRCLTFPRNRHVYHRGNEPYWGSVYHDSCLESINTEFDYVN